MPPAPVPAHFHDFLSRPQPAIVASVRADGSPHSTPTWYEWRDGRILLNMDDSRLRLRFLRHDPRLSLTVLSSESWYEHLTLTGHVVTMEPDSDLSGIHRIARHYTGADYPDTVSPRTNAWVEVEAWHSWGLQGAAGTDG